jgi:hypothetical protein
MATTFFGFALSDSIFNDNVVITRRNLSTEEFKDKIKTAIPCLNPSHVATINALKERFGVEVEIPAQPPKISLEAGDSLIVLTVRGLPRLTDRHEFTKEEIDSATFTFAEIHVLTIRELEELSASVLGFGSVNDGLAAAQHS